MADLEPSQYRLAIEDVSSPQSIRFLTHLQAADAGVLPASAQIVTSSGGTAFEGALVRTTAVLFPVDLSVPFASLSYSVPATTTLHLITGLVPGSTYDATLTNSGGSTDASVVPGTTYRADDGGVLTLPAPGSRLSFYTVTPCRILDTRNADGPYGAPTFSPGGATRDVLLAGRCGIPWDAQAVSANLVLISHGAAGYVAAAAPGSLFPQTSTVFVRPLQNRANNAILALTGNPPGVSRFVLGMAGTADLVIDVNGYFR